MLQVFTMDDIYSCLTVRFIWLFIIHAFGVRAVQCEDQGISPSTDQTVVDYIAKYGQINVSVVDNIHKVDNYVTLRLQLTNTGSTVITAGHWRIYYYALYGVGSKGEILDCGLRVCPIDKGLFYFTPVVNLFQELSPGETLNCTYHNKKWSVARTDQMPNWYVTSGQAEPKLLESTRGESLSFVGQFDTPAQWKRSKEDKYNPYTPEERYALYELNLDITKDVRLVPTPLKVSLKTEASLECNAESGWMVVISEECQFETEFLAGKLFLPMVQHVPSAKYIKYVVNESRNEIDPEWYGLDIDPSNNVITIIAEDCHGAMHASQSLISLIDSDGGRVPKMSLTDRPRFPHRGLMLDTARNFKPKAWVLKLIDALSMYKLNILHLHLTDDEGWRIELPALPELTQVGSQRFHSDETLCLIPNLGSGPTNTTHGSGFYSVNDYREILKYAANRHITIIPEIDIPGHSTAAIRAMSWREKRLRSENYTSIDTESYLLNDVESDVIGCQTTFERFNAINPCMNSTYRFVEKVVDELIWLHRDVMPLSLIHVGGDEVAGGVWDNSPACQQLDKHGQVSTRKLQRLFLRRVSEILSSRGLRMGVWDDGVYSEDDPDNLTDFNTSIQVYPWDNRWETGHAKRAYQFADAGYKVVLTHATHLYFSHTYEPDPEERGVSWATRVVDTRKVFGMMPDDIYSNADATSMGDPVDLQEMCQNGQCPKASKPENIIGIQACLWSETIRTEDQLHYMIFPKLIALAERAWHKAPWEDLSDVTARDRQRDADWAMFVNELGTKELPRLERRGLLYRVPPPGARMEGDMLMTNSQYPNHVVEISKDGGATWTVVMGKTRLSSERSVVHLRSRSPVLHRTSRVLKLQVHETSSATQFDIQRFLQVLIVILTVDILF